MYLIKYFEEAVDTLGSMVTGWAAAANNWFLCKGPYQNHVIWGGSGRLPIDVENSVYFCILIILSYKFVYTFLKIRRKNTKNCEKTKKNTKKQENFEFFVYTQKSKK